jgi:respiratory nitrate reductase gamma subunit
MNLSALDLLLFVVLPYVALFTAIAGMAYRYWKQPGTVSSFSSQLLEGRKQFWAVVLFHYGVLATLLGHAIGLLIPRQVLAWNAQPLRLYVLESVAIALGATAFLGIVLAISRRAATPRLWAVTSKADLDPSRVVIRAATERPDHCLLPPLGRVLVSGVRCSLPAICFYVPP